jgi:DNA-binding transcriptional ArsR family regulator
VVPVQPVHDPQVLRAIAHPVRNRILSELDARGSLRAADIARLLDIPANQASFHLRQLAKYGLVEEDPDAGRDRRDRVWKAVSADGLSVDLKRLEQLPDGKAAAAVFRRNAASWGHLVVDRVYSSEREEGTYTSLTDSSLLLSREEAPQFAAELTELVERWAERTRGNGGDRRTYLCYAAVLPYPDVEALDGGGEA